MNPADKSHQDLLVFHMLLPLLIFQVSTKKSRSLRKSPRHRDSSFQRKNSLNFLFPEMGLYRSIASPHYWRSKRERSFRFIIIPAEVECLEHGRNGYCLQHSYSPPVSLDFTSSVILILPSTLPLYQFPNFVFMNTLKCFPQ